MACAMIYWNSSVDIFQQVFNEFGAVVDLRSLQGKIIGGRNKFQQPKLFEDMWVS